MRRHYFIFAFFLFFLSCSKHDEIKSVEINNSSTAQLPKISIKSSSLKSGTLIGNYPINLDAPPRDININGAVFNGFKYWFDYNVSSTVPYSIRNDFQQEDGWEVVYNTIVDKNTATVTHPFIGLYNKFRGIFRFFYYHPLASQGNDLVAILALDGPSIETCKIFEQPTIGISIPYSDPVHYKAITTSKISRNLLESSGGLTQLQWYCFDFDVTCFDPNISSGSFDFQIIQIERSNIELSGNINGTIQGVIQGPQTSPSFKISSLYTKNIDNSTKVNTNIEVNEGNIDDIKTIIKGEAEVSSVSPTLKGFFDDLVDKGLGALQDGVGSFLESGISGLFSSITKSLFWRRTNRR